MQRLDREPMVALAIIAAAIIAGCKHPSPSAGAAPASASKKTTDTDVARLTLTPATEARLGLTVEPAVAKRSSVTRTFGGDVVPPSGRALVVVAPVSGTVNAAGGTMVRAGQALRRGDPIVRLTPVAGIDRDVRAQADRGVAAADARLSAAEARLSRTEKLVEAGSASERNLEEARTDRDVVRAERDAARARLGMLDRAPLEADVAVTLRAPQDGVVRQVSVGAGGMVAAGAPLFEIVATDAQWLKVSIFAGDRRSVRAGASARVRGLTDRPSAEDVEALPIEGPPTADPATVTYDLYFALPQKTDFRPGERVAVTVAYAGETSRVVVPWSSVVYDASGGATVYAALEPSVFERRRVEVDHVEGRDAYLVRGVDAGARIVATGAAELWAFELGNAK